MPINKKPTYEELESRVRALGAYCSELEGKLKAENIRQYENIVSSTSDGIALLDKNYHYLIVNDAYQKFSGIKREQFIGRNVSEYLGEDVFNQFVKPHFDKCLQGHTVIYQEWFDYPSIGRRFVEVTYIPYKDGGENISGVLSNTRDITERKIAEDALQRVRFSIENLSESVFWVGENGSFTDVNATACRKLGYTREELLTMSVADIDPYFPAEKWTPHWDEMKRCGMKVFETVHRAKNGRLIPMELVVHNQVFGNERHNCVLGRDITEQKKIEENILKLTGRLNLALSSARAGVWDWNIKTGEMIWDDRMLELYGLTRENFPGGVEAWEQGLHPKDSANAIEECQAALRGELEFDTEFRVRRPDGTVIHIKANGLVQRDKEGKPIRMIGLNTDITDRKRAEEALLESERRFQKMLGVVPDMISIHSPQMDILYSNWQGFAGVPEDRRITNTKCYKTYRGLDTICPDCRARSVLETRRPFHEEARLPDGTWVDLRAIPFLDEAGNVEMFMEWVRDITEHKQAEEEKERLQIQLMQAQKMESVGRLAGGVAHDFNNMLGVILGHAEMALEQVAHAEPLRADLEEIQKAAQRSADITRQLLAFARKQTIAPRVIDLNAAVNSALKMIERLIGEDIDLVWVPEDRDLWPIRMDPSQIDQILANLCVNARDAITDVGKITIETGKVRFDDAYCAAHPGFAPGDFALLAVSDDGCGMDKQTQANLFEPFFTTKDVDRGTGLGLATVYGIVKQNSGFINVYSEPGQGTTFKIYLPRHAATTDRETDRHQPQAMVRGRETILLVEDEPSILRMTRMMLHRIGYKVLVAGTPGEAMALAREHVGEIHLLMTDVVMPEMNGRELARNLLSLYPNIKRLFMSGYTANVIAHHGVLEPGVHFIQKPFAKGQLAIKVREALETILTAD